MGELEQAINRARAAAPSVGNEASLSAEVAVLGGLYGRMIFEGAQQVAIDALSVNEKSVLSLYFVAR
jgi:Protein of unknown function (DUF3717)